MNCVISKAFIKTVISAMLGLFICLVGIALADTDTNNETADFSAGGFISVSQMQSMNETLAAILKAVNPDGTDAGKVSNRVANLGQTLADSLNKLFISDGTDQLSLVDKILQGYFKSFFKVFLGEQTDNVVQTVDATELRELTADLISKNGQFINNADGGEVTSLEEETYNAVNSVTNLVTRNKGSTITTNVVSPVEMFSGNSSSKHSIYDYPNGQDFLGLSSYGEDNAKQQQRAALFMRMLLGGASVMSDLNFSYDKSNKKINAYFPSSSKSAGYDYEYKDSSTDDYKTFKEELAKFKTYQNFQMKKLANNALRSLYTEIMLTAYLNRLPKVKVTDSRNQVQYKSVQELEEAMVRIGIDTEYLEKIKQSTVADLRVEELAALNRIVYFLYKIHRDCELTALGLSAAAIKLTAPDNSTEASYYTPIKNWFKNECWKSENKETDSCKNISSGSSSSGNVDQYTDDLAATQ